MHKVVTEYRVPYADTDQMGVVYYGNYMALFERARNELLRDHGFTYKACEELGLDCQLSLERHMKCGAGVCGCCVMDGQRVCKDGPVFNRSELMWG